MVTWQAEPWEELLVPCGRPSVGAAHFHNFHHRYRAAPGRLRDAPILLGHVLSCRHVYNHHRVAHAAWERRGVDGQRCKRVSSVGYPTRWHQETSPLGLFCFVLFCDE